MNRWAVRRDWCIGQERECKTLHCVTNMNSVCVRERYHTMIVISMLCFFFSYHPSQREIEVLESKLSELSGPRFMKREEFKAFASELRKKTGHFRALKVSGWVGDIGYE